MRMGYGRVIEYLGYMVRCLPRSLLLVKIFPDLHPMVRTMGGVARWGQVFTFDIPCKQAMEGRLAPNILGADLCRLLHDRQFLRYEFVAYGLPVIPERNDDH